jgi:hypothetical protein
MRINKKQEENIEEYNKNYREAQQKVDEFICYIFSKVKLVVKSIVLSPVHLLALVVALPVILVISIYEFAVQIVMFSKKL